MDMATIFFTVVGTEEERNIHALVQLRRSEDGRTFDHGRNDGGGSGTQPMIGICACANDGTRSRIGQFGLRLNRLPVILLTD